MPDDDLLVCEFGLLDEELDICIEKFPGERLASFNFEYGGVLLPSRSHPGSSVGQFILGKFPRWNGCQMSNGMFLVSAVRSGRFPSAIELDAHQVNRR